MAKVKFPRRKRRTQFVNVYQTETILMTKEDVESILRKIPKEVRIRDYINLHWNFVSIENSLYEVSFVMTEDPTSYGLPCKGVGKLEV